MYDLKKFYLSIKLLAPIQVLDSFAPNIALLCPSQLVTITNELRCDSGSKLIKVYSFGIRKNTIF